MQLFSRSGALLYTSPASAARQALQSAMQTDAPLSQVNLRRASLRWAELDGLRAPGACLWGADLTLCDLADADLRESDCRMATLKETCLAGANLSGTDFSGAYFSGVLLEEADFSGCVFSCPSILRQSLHVCRSLKGAVYWHQGEHPCDLSAGVQRWQTGGHDVISIGDVLIADGLLVRPSAAKNTTKSRCHG